MCESPWTSRAVPVGDTVSPTSTTQSPDAGGAVLARAVPASTASRARRANVRKGPAAMRPARDLQMALLGEAPGSSMLRIRGRAVLYLLERGWIPSRNPRGAQLAQKGVGAPLPGRGRLPRRWT